VFPQGVDEAFREQCDVVGMALAVAHGDASTSSAQVWR
jgi:hypothetical protein